MMPNVVCMKWGRRYPAEYVNRLHRMVQGHLALEHRFVCLTDDARGIGPGIECLPLPDFPLPRARRSVPWRKVGLFEPRLHDLSGTALFLDLDLVIVGGLDPFFAHRPGEFCIIPGWARGHRGNSSVFRFEVGGLPEVAARFRADPEAVVGRWRGDQEFVCDLLGDRVNLWPRGWCRSFKHDCLRGRWLDWVLPPRLPAEARVVVFHGRPKPPDASAGFWRDRGWRVRGARWIVRHWGASGPSVTASPAPSPAPAAARRRPRPSAPIPAGLSSPSP
jgi:hypothetical protein